MRSRRTVRILASAACIGMALTIAACSSSTAGPSTKSSNSSSSAPAGSAASGERAAAAAIAAFIGKPTDFPVTDALKTVPKGKTFTYVNCGTTYCGLIYTLLQQAGKAMGVNIRNVTAGISASTISSAFNAVVADKPAAVMVVGVNIDLWTSQLKQLQAAHIPVIAVGVIGATKAGIEASQGAEAYTSLAGKVMADYVTAKFSTTSKVVVYTNPELAFTGAINSSFDKELSTVCPGCSVRTVQIPVAQDGNIAPNTVVRDLQKNSGTTVTVFPNNELADGLPAALAAAGLKVKIMGSATSPTELQYVKEGKQTVGLGLDTAVLTWTMLDTAAREVTGQPLTGREAAGIPVMQFLTQPDITFNPNQGWTGYPDFASRFKTLWGVN